MNSLDRWRLRRALLEVVERLKLLHLNSPEDKQTVRLAGSGWTYNEWSYFYALKASWRAHPDDLARLVKTAGPELCDVLLAFAIRIDASARTAAFTSSTSLRELLVVVVKVVLERAPDEFVTSDWIEKKMMQGTAPLLHFRV